MNLQDCQFTVLALLPTLSQQIFDEMNVEGLSAQLAQQAAKIRAQELEQLRLEEAERQKLHEDPPEQSIITPKLNATASIFVPSFGTTPTYATVAKSSIQESVVEESTSVESTTKEDILSKSWAQVVHDGEGQPVELASTIVRLFH